MDKKILILNDNKTTLDSWIYLLKDKATGFLHPRNILLDFKNEESIKIFNIFILDRQCSDLFDVVNDHFVNMLKRKGAQGIFFLSSIMHPEGDKVEDFDYSLGPIPKDYDEIMFIIRREKLENKL